MNTIESPQVDDTLSSLFDMEAAMKMLQPTEEHDLSSSEEETTCASNISGYEKVAKLASFLLHYKDSDQLSLNIKQANSLIDLWTKLEPFDKKRTKRQKQ